MKKVLIITYYWPPSGGAGVQRWLKMSKYLPEFGVEPIILTVDPQYASYAQNDSSLELEISPNIKVYKTKTFEFYNLYKRLTRKKEIPYGGFANGSKNSFSQQLAKFIRGNLFLPDPRRGWNKYAYKKAIQLIQEHNIQTVITTSPPHSTQLIGLKLKKNIDIKWIADLRDPWTDIYYYKELYHLPLIKRLDKNLEKKVLTKSDQIITVSEDLKRIFNDKTKNLIEDKIIVIPNGYDEDDFNLNINSDTDKFVITYTGTISEAYRLDGFIKALQMLSTEEQNNLKIRFVGKTPTSIVKNIKENAPNIEIELTGYVQHQKSIEYLLRSSLQLLIIPDVANNKGIVTGKFYEYLASNKPILAIGPKDGDLNLLLKETSSGNIYDYMDHQGLSRYLYLCLTKNFTLKENLYKNYSRKELTHILIKSI